MTRSALMRMSGASAPNAQGRAGAAEANKRASVPKLPELDSRGKCREKRRETSCGTPLTLEARHRSPPLSLLDREPRADLCNEWDPLST